MRSSPSRLPVKRQSSKRKKRHDIGHDFPQMLSFFGTYGIHHLSVIPKYQDYYNKAGGQCQAFPKFSPSSHNAKPVKIRHF